VTGNSVTSNRRFEARRSSHRGGSRRRRRRAEIPADSPGGAPANVGDGGISLLSFMGMAGMGSSGGRDGDGGVIPVPVATLR
jgi:hypothetical protein